MKISSPIPRQMSRGTSKKHRQRYVLGVLLASLTTLLACQPEKPKMVGGLTGVVFNYDQTSYAFVRVNGKEVGGGLDAAKLGGYTGGGGGMCCNAIPVGAREVEVTLDPAKGNAITFSAPVEKWWPDAANYIVVHILPEKTAVVQIRNNLPHARADLLEKRQEELGLPKHVSSKGYWLDGPEIRTDGKE